MAAVATAEELLLELRQGCRSTGGPLRRTTLRSPTRPHQLLDLTSSHLADLPPLHHPLYHTFLHPSRDLIRHLTANMSLVVPEAHVQFQHILRLLNTNVDGKRKIMVRFRPLPRACKAER